MVPTDEYTPYVEQKTKEHWVIVVLLQSFLHITDLKEQGKIISNRKYYCGYHSHDNKKHLLPVFTLIGIELIRTCLS